MQKPLATADINLSANLRKLRIACGRTQKETAQLMNVSLSTYRRWEGQKTHFKLHHLLKVADFYQIAAYLLVE